MMLLDEQSLAVLGERLREARRARRMSQASAAESIGVSRPTLIAVEQGKRRPQASELVKLARLYGRHVHEFTRASPPAYAVSARFRLSMAPEKSPELNAVAELEQLAEDVLELEALVGAQMPRRYPDAYDVEGLQVEAAAAQVAEAERQRLGLGDGPVLQLRSILEDEVGLKVFSFKLPPAVAGLFVLAEPAGACIGINSQHPFERQRWTLAHEYGHFLTDRWSAEVTELESSRTQATERFAEAFAARFLMPSSSLTRRFQSVRRSRGGKFTAADLLQLSSHYQASAQAFALRLEDLGLLGGGWWEDLVSRGLKVIEARSKLGIAEAARDEELLPLRLRYLAVEAYIDGKLSEGRLAELLRTDRVAVRELALKLGKSSDVGIQGNLQSWTWASKSVRDE